MTETEASNNMLMSKGKIDISRLKKFAIESLPKDWALREVLLSEESDELDIHVFLARLPVYLKLARLNQGGRI